MRLAGKIALTLAGVVMAGCATAGPTPTISLPSGRGTASPTPTVPLPPGQGEVVGGIQRCYGVIPPSATAQFVAGTVDVYPGPNPASNEAPMASQTVATNGMFHLVLAPGTYTLVGLWAGTNLAQVSVEVTVTAGLVRTVNLVYTGCL